MLKFAPFVLMLLYGFALYRFSAWRTARELEARSSPMTDPEVRRQTDLLARALNLPQVRVHLYEVPAVNGLAAPDGRIYLTRGFYQQFLSGAVSAEELASVIAHELGHVALGHSRRRMIDFSGQNALRMLLAGVLGRFLPGIGVVLANLVTGMLAARLSRKDEYEADAYAAALLTRAGIGTSPQKSLFRKLGALTGAAGTGPAWLLTHPETRDRIAAIEALETRWAVAARG